MFLLNCLYRCWYQLYGKYRFALLYNAVLLGHRVQSVTCLTADPGVMSLILTRSHTFMEIDHEIISTATLLPSTDSRRVVVSYKRTYMYKVLVNYLVKLAQEKVWLGELIVLT